MDNTNKLSLETINKLGLVDNIINLYVNIPNRNWAKDAIYNTLKKMDISDKNIFEINNALDQIGINKLNKDGLNEFISQKLVSDYNISENRSIEIVNLSNRIIASYLERIIRDVNTAELRKSNESQEAFIQLELEKLKNELNERLEIKKNKLKIFEEQLQNESDLTVAKFVEASNSWLENPTREEDRQKLKDDVDNFLNGDNNIIIEL
jgi:hypothetical protein